MSLLSIIKQGVSQVSDLISKQPVDSNSDLNSVNKIEKSNWFADLFNKPGTQTPGFNSSKQSLNQLSTNFLADKSSTDVEMAAQKRISERDSQEQNKASLEQQFVKNAEAATVNLSGDDTPAGYVQVPVVLPHNYPTPQQESRAILTGLKFKDSDIQAYNEHYKTDLVKDMSVGLGGKNLNHNAGRRVYVPSEKKDVYVGYIAIDGKTHKNLKDFITARRTGGELPAIENNSAKANNKPSNIKLDPVTVTVLAGGGAGLAATMIETMPSQIATDIVPRAMEAGAKVAPFLADVAVPATLIAAEAAPTVFIAQHAAQDYMEAKGEHEQATAARTYDAARDLAKATTATMTMDDAEPQMQPVPETKPKSQPYAEPQAKPQVQDLPDAPTDTTIAPVPKAKPDIKADDLPQPYTPDVPKGTPPQLEPPKFEFPKLPPGIAEAITGLAATAIGVKAKDMLDGGKIPSSTPVRYDNVNLSLEMKAEFEKLAAYRADKTFPPAAKNYEAGTVAQLTIDGKTVYGHSTVNERAVLGKDNETLRRGLLKDLQDAGYLDKNLKYNEAFKVGFLTHAETEAILNARQDLGSLQGKDLTIYVDRKPCQTCYNHLPKVAELYGIKSITLVSSNPSENPQIVIITPNGTK